MSNLEHLVENGLGILENGYSSEEWFNRMSADINWEYVENITVDDLWEICQYVFYTWADRKTEPQKIGYCNECKWFRDKQVCGRCRSKNMYAPKDEQIRACDICKYESGETCTHPKVKTMKKEWETFEGDLWGEKDTPKWCPIGETEPQTERSK